MSKLMPSRGNIDYTQHTGAKGGAALGRTRDFLKEPDEFRELDEGKRQSRDVVGDLSDEDQHYAKSGAGKGTGCAPALKSARSGDKSLTAIKPRG